MGKNMKKNNNKISKLKITSVTLPKPKTIIPCNSNNTYNVTQISAAKHTNAKYQKITPHTPPRKSSRQKKIISILSIFLISFALLFHSCISYEHRMNIAFEITLYSLDDLKFQKLKVSELFNMGYLLNRGYTRKYAKYLRYLYEIPGSSIFFEEGWMKIQFVTNAPPVELKQAIQNRLSRIWSSTEIQYQDYTPHQQNKLYQFYIYLVSPRKDFVPNEDEKEYIKGN